MGYVEEDDEEREEGAGETDEQYETQLGSVRQCGARGQEAPQTRD